MTHAWIICFLPLTSYMILGCLLTQDSKFFICKMEIILTSTPKRVVRLIGDTASKVLRRDLSLREHPMNVNNYY